MSVAIVVPCFNEAARITPAAFQRLTLAVDRLILVDDGSTDATAEALDSVAAAAPPGTVEVIRLGSKSREGRSRADRSAGGERRGRHRRLLRRRLRHAGQRARAADPGDRRSTGTAGCARQSRGTARPLDRPTCGTSLSRPDVRHRRQPDVVGAGVRHAVRRQAVPHRPHAHSRPVHPVPRPMVIRRRAAGTPVVPRRPPPTAAAQTRSSRCRCSSGGTWADRSSTPPPHCARWQPSAVSGAGSPPVASPGQRDRRRSRRVSAIPHLVTSSIDSTMIRPDIFDLPWARSRNTIGVSTIRYPCRVKRRTSSVRKA